MARRFACVCGDARGPGLPSATLRRGPASPTIRAERGIRSSRGALIVNTSSRVTEEIGIERGDVIVQINRTPIEGAQDAARALDLYSGRGPIRMFFERARGNIYSTDFIIR